MSDIRRDPVPYERERNDDLRRALRRRPGAMAPWAKDIERLLNLGDAWLDWLEAEE